MGEATTLNPDLLVVSTDVAVVGIAAGLRACDGQTAEPTPGPRLREPALVPATAPTTPTEEKRSARAADGMIVLRVPARGFVLGSDAPPRRSALLTPSIRIYIGWTGMR